MALDREIQGKLRNLDRIIQSAGPCAVAFSGGIDSLFLLSSAVRVLGTAAAAVTVQTPYTIASEYLETEKFTEQHGIRHIVVSLDIPDAVRENPADRCYLCKKELFTHIVSAVRSAGFSEVFEGSNQSDLSDYRPGMKAVRELGIRSPLLECGFTKGDIRKAAEARGLPEWNKPANSCLLTRIPQGERVDREKLQRIGKAEEVLANAGFSGVRVRDHGEIARIEISGEQMNRLSVQHDGRLYKRIDTELKGLGFRYVCVDLGGYQRGSMNNERS